MFACQCKLTLKLKKSPPFVSKSSVHFFAWKIDKKIKQIDKNEFFSIPFSLQPSTESSLHQRGHQQDLWQGARRWKGHFYQQKCGSQRWKLLSWQSTLSCGSSTSSGCHLCRFSSRISSWAAISVLVSIVCGCCTERKHERHKDNHQGCWNPILWPRLLGKRDSSPREDSIFELQGQKLGQRHCEWIDTYFK